MRYKLLGSSGLRVSEICLGTMTFGEDWGWGASKEDSRAVFDAFVEAGGNFIDTANRYTNGTSEKYVGEFIASDRERFVLATKYSLFTRQGDPNSAGNHRKNMMQAVEASLKRLNTDYIDLYWLHAWDFMTPVEEVMRAFDDLVRSGKVLYIGVSDTPAWIVSRANTIAELRGWTRFIGLQIEYSLVERTPERDLLPMAHALGLTVTAWSPLAGGALSGKYRKGGTTQSQRLGEISERNLTIAETAAEVADEIGCTTAQVALAWIAHQADGVISIIGARKLEQVKENLAYTGVQLSADQMAKLDAISKIDLGFPQRFLMSPGVRNLVTAGMDDQIDKR